MKIEWQSSDIKSGRIVASPGRSDRLMIGYFADKGDCFALISITDGRIGAELSASAMAEQLNKSGAMPAEFLEPEGRAKGGRARAAALSPERRSEIASDAAKARWDNSP